MTSGAKHYVGRKIEQALQRGAKRIDRDAARFAGVEEPPLLPARPQTLKISLEPEDLQAVDVYRSHARRGRASGHKNLSREEAILQILRQIAG